LAPTTYGNRSADEALAPTFFPAGWIRRGENSRKDYVSLSLAAPEFGPPKLYANLGRAAGQDDGSMFAIIWNPAD
jgi:uncharacterized protein (DUF736 family)